MHPSKKLKHPSAIRSNSHLCGSPNRRIFEEQQRHWDAWKDQAVNAAPPPQYTPHMQHQPTATASAAAGVPNTNGGYAPPNLAVATGSIGPDGVHQTVLLQPEEPQAPRIDAHFPAVPGVPGAGGFVGVSTASFSSSSNVNGVKSQHKSAVTTVNDNGKVTTYKLES